MVFIFFIAQMAAIFKTQENQTTEVLLQAEHCYKLLQQEFWETGVLLAVVSMLEPFKTCTNI